MRLITAHEIQMVLIHQDTFAGGHLCNSLYIPLSLGQAPLWYDISSHNTFHVSGSPKIPPLVHYPYSVLPGTYSVSFPRLLAFGETRGRYIGSPGHYERLDELPDCFYCQIEGIKYQLIVIVVT